MSHRIDFREAPPRVLTEKFLRRYEKRQLGFRVGKLTAPQDLWEENILAVHFADGGAQGDAGAVYLLCRTGKGVEVLYGNYAYGDLDLNAVLQVLPMLKPLDSRYSLEPPYPFGGPLEVPDGWQYLYMGAMNHFFARDLISIRARRFLEHLLQHGGQPHQIFHAVAWLCNAK